MRRLSCSSVAGLGAACLVLGSLSGCQTGPPSAPPAPTATPPPIATAPFDFVPADYRAPIRMGDVRYRLLYAPESHAIWITDEVNAMKLDSDLSQGIAIDDDVRAMAEMADTRFIVIECRLESAFADSSVAYDVVGLRNVEVYVETPAGERVYPVQRIMAPHADETPQDALIRFGRTTVLVFPKYDMLSGGVSPLSGAPALRLVLEGFHSRFYFEWQHAGDAAMVEMSEVGSGVSGSSALDAVRTGYTSIYSLLSPLKRIVE